MGNLIWHEYARFLSITSSVYTIWASFWGFFYRKFFWDFVGGTLRDPGGIQAPKSSAVFVTLIVKAPMVQILAMLVAFVLLAFEWPLPRLRGTMIHRTLISRVILLILQAFLAALFYQGGDGAVWSTIAAICYGRAILKGEKYEEATENKGQGEKV